MNRIAFSISGEPKGKGRPRTAKGQSRPYTPKETVLAERAIRAEFVRLFPGHKAWTGPIMLRFTAVFSIPKSFDAALRQAALEGKLYAIKKPDKDNIEKLLCDSLNGVAWADDAQLQGGGVKRYGHPPRVDVELVHLIAGDTPKTPGQQRQEAKRAQIALGLGNAPRRRGRKA